MNNLIGGHLQMKRKLIIALAAAMTITLGSVGVVSADDANFAPFIPVKETPIRDGFVWIVDTPAWTETVNHPEEGHYENGALISPEEGHTEHVLVKEAWDEQVLVKEAWDEQVLVKDAWDEIVHHDAVYETVHHEEEGHYELLTVCSNCGYIATSEQDIVNHIQENFENGCQGWKNEERWIVDKPAWDEQVVVKPAWDETVHHEAEYKTVHHEAEYKTVHHEAVYEDKWIVDKPAEYEQVWVVDKEAYTETIEHPEVGHWEPIPENPDEQEPETPQNPDEQEPETPQNPDEQEPETPQNPDEQDSETPDNNQNNNENNNQNENNSQNNNENTSQNNNSSETNNSQDDSTGKQPPKTGDPTSFASLYALAGSALAGIGAVKLKFRKRK